MSVKKVAIIIAAILLVMIPALLLVNYNRVKKPVVLELGIFSGSNWDVPNWQRYKIFDEAIEEFERLNPNIKIKYRSGTLKDDYSEWLAQKIVTGREPDVFAVLPSDFNTLASIGILKNLDELIAGDKDFDINRMYENAVKTGQFQGSQYALPSEVVPVLMFVNKTLLQKEGIPMPQDDWTWDDFNILCKKLTKDTDGDGIIDQFGTAGFTWQHAVYTNGQQLFDANGTTACFDKSGVLEAIKFVRDIHKLSLNAKVEDFNSGRVAFSPFTFPSYRVYKNYPYRIKMFNKFDWECIKLPRGPHGRNASELYNFPIGISSRTRHINEAWKFLEFLTVNEATQMNVFRYSQGVPVLRGVVESKEAEDIVFKNNIQNENFIDTKVLGQIIEQSIVTPRFQKYEQAMGMADKEIFQIIEGGKNPEDTLLKLNRELKSFLKQ